MALVLNVLSDWKRRFVMTSRDPWFVGDKVGSCCTTNTTVCRTVNMPSLAPKLEYNSDTSVLVSTRAGAPDLTGTNARDTVYLGRTLDVLYHDCLCISM